MSSDLRRRAEASAPATPLPTNATLFAQVEEYFETRMGYLARAVDKHVDPAIFLARVMTEVRKNTDLLACTPSSLMGAVLNCAQLGLMPGPLGHYYFTPRRNKGVDEVVGVVGWKGYLELARRAVPLAIDADARHENDFWEYERGTTPRLRTWPPDDGDRGQVLGYWAAATWGGGSAMQYMSLPELGAHARKYSSNRDGNVMGFARSNWSAWCLKTAVRQMAWKLPSSSQMALALETDEAPTYFRDEAGTTVTVHTDGRTTENDPPEEAVVTPLADGAGGGEDGSR